MIGFLRAGRRGLSTVSAKASLLTKSAPVTSFVRTEVVTAKPYFEVEVIDGVAVVRMDQENGFYTFFEKIFQNENLKLHIATSWLSSATYDVPHVTYSAWRVYVPISPLRYDF